MKISIKYRLLCTLFSFIFFAGQPAHALPTDFKSNLREKLSGYQTMFDTWSSLTGFFNVHETYYVPSKTEIDYFNTLNSSGLIQSGMISPGDVKLGDLNNIVVVVTGTPNGELVVKFVVVNTDMPIFDDKFEYKHHFEEKKGIFYEYQKNEWDKKYLFKAGINKLEIPEDYYYISDESLAPYPPTPEPSSMILGIMGIGALIGSKRFKLNK